MGTKLGIRSLRTGTSDSHARALGSRAREEARGIADQGEVMWEYGGHRASPRPQATQQSARPNYGIYARAETASRPKGRLPSNLERSGLPRSGQESRGQHGAPPRFRWAHHSEDKTWLRC